MSFILISASLAIGLFFSSVLLQMLGRHIGRGAEVGNFWAIESGVFGLLGLLLAFTFSSALSRFDERRQLIVVEANAIAAAYNNLDLLPPELRGQLRAIIKDYLALRISVSRIPHGFVEEDHIARTSDTSERLLVQVVDAVIAASRQSSSDTIGQVLLPSLNEASSVARNRNALALRHPPVIVYVFLFSLALTASLLAGGAIAPRERGAMSSTSKLHMVSLALALAASVYVILEIEFPRQGFIRLDNYDQVLINLLKDR